MKCPICKKHTGQYKEETTEPGDFVMTDYPFYQRSYPGEPGYLPPRCLKCYEKVENRR